MRCWNKSLFFGLMAGLLIAGATEAAETRTISLKDYRDKMAGGWIGQIAGVSQGAPTEFKWKDKIIPEAEMPAWKPEMINNAFCQDDLYVEMTFLRTMELYGLTCTIRQAGIDFANSAYPLWCANNAGRSNLRKGIAPPDSGHPQFNKCPNDIDYQIEADYSGLIAPGIPQAAVSLGEKFGRLMNYGDGLYAGQFIGAMYAEAFFESNPVTLVQKALQAIPAQSQYAEMVRDMLTWYKEDPNDWEGCWKKCQKKYRENPNYQKASNGGIDCKINGAYVLMGLLYGNRDMDKTITISCRCGHDSDCNPSSSAGILATTIGFDQLPKEYTDKLFTNIKFDHTEYEFIPLLNVCEKLARQVVGLYGGKVETQNGEEVFVIPVIEAHPSKMEYSWAPGPIANSKFTPEEMAKMTWQNQPSEIQKNVNTLFPGWTIKNCGQDMNPGIRGNWQGEKNVLCVHPLDREIGCTLQKKITIPADKKTSLTLKVGNDPQGDFDLVVAINGKTIAKNLISNETTENHWTTKTFDLTPYAGKEITIELTDQPNGWEWEAAYWKTIKITNE